MAACSGFGAAGAGEAGIATTGETATFTGGSTGGATAFASGATGGAALAAGGEIGSLAGGFSGTEALAREGEVAGTGACGAGRITDITKSRMLSSAVTSLPENIPG